MKKRLPYILVGIVVLTFVLGMFRIYHLRFRRGDVYAPYSSLRADPVGAMALREAFSRLPGVAVESDIRPVNKLPDGKGTAYLHIGANAVMWASPSEEMIREAERFAAAGGRLIILLRPVNTTNWNRTSFFEEANEEPKKASKRKKSKRKPAPISPHIARWSFDFAYASLSETDEETFAPEVVHYSGTGNMPATLDWHSGLVLTNLPPDWTPIYLRGTDPVMAELRRGPGSIVIGTDSYYLSNEALSRSPEPKLLAWLIGPRNRIVFDEAHLGTVESSGVAVLMRKYRLGWFIAGLLVLFGLWLWRQSAPLLSRARRSRQPEFVAGRAASLGFVNLLRRNVAARELPKVCLDQWKQHCMQGSGGERKAAAAERLMREHSGDPVKLYNDLCSILKTHVRSHSNEQPKT